MRTLLVLLIALAAGASAAFLEDAQGDVNVLVAEEVPIGPAPTEPADLWSLDIWEDVDNLYFEVQSAGRGTATAGQTWDAARLDVRFSHGEVFFDIGTGIEISGDEIAELRRANGPGLEQIVGPLELESDGAGNFNVTVPRDWLRDHNGAPPQEGSLLENMHMDAHVHSTGLFMVDPRDGSLLQPLGIRDRMPDAGDVVYSVKTGGAATTGELELDVPLPFRASNGGAAQILYEAHVNGTDTYTAELTFVNPEWTVTFPETITAPDTFQFVVETPDKHLHGGIEELTFQFTGTNPENTGTATFGILYLETPQPAGHHPNIYFHTRTTPQPIAGQFGGGTNGVVSFNTLQDDPNDEDVGITAGGPASVAGFWNMCLEPELRLGIQTNRSKPSELTFYVEGDDAGTASLEWFMTPNTNCGGPERELIAVSTHDGPINGALTFEFPPVEFRQAYEKGLTMGFRLELRYDAPQTGYSTVTGGEGILPLDEYYDERPAGLTGDTVVEVEPEPEPVLEEAEETPLPLLLPIAALLLARRRR